MMQKTTGTTGPPDHIKYGNDCLNKFAVNGQAPIFATANTVAICQRVKESKVDAEYATLFDTSLRIPRYSVYAVDPVKVGEIPKTSDRSGDTWKPTPGLFIYS